MVTVDETHPGWGTRADPTSLGLDALTAGATPEVTTYVGRADGVEVSVGVRPEPGAGHSGVLLDVSTAAQEATARVRLGPSEAHRLAAALSAAACATAGRTPGATVFAGPATPGHHPDHQHLGHRFPSGPEPRTQPEPESDTGLPEITAVEGTTVAELSAALAQLPIDAVLLDFASDAEVSLFFGPPAAADIAAQT